jgi:hypothetical protein
MSKDERSIHPSRITHHASRITGVITIAQEDRIRVVDAAGRGYLFVLGKGVRRSLPELWRLARERRTVTVRYEGTPDLGAVATDLRVER